VKEYIGIKFPYQKGRRGFPATVTGQDAIKSDLLFLFKTKKRSRVMKPQMGLGLEQIVFENTGPLLRARLHRAIARVVADYEPRITIEQLIVQENKTEVIIDLYYSFKDVSDSLTFDIPKSSDGV